MKFEEILEACWKGYHKEGMKTMFGKRYPNCVKNKKKKNEDMEPDLEEGKRIARKPGQPAGSKKHSDLYTDENPRGTITGLKFATVQDARASVSKIRNSGRSHAHKIQAAVAMEQRARAAGKASAAAVYRRYINANKRADEDLEQEITERCWTGYAQQGMKKKGDRMVPNCVRVAEDHTPDHTTAMSLAQDLNTMMADVEEIRHAGEASTNLNYLRELQRRIGVTEKQIRNLGFKYDVNHPDLVKPLGRPLAEIESIEEAYDPFLDNAARDLLALVVMAGVPFAIAVYQRVRNSLDRYRAQQIIQALIKRGVKMDRETYVETRPILDEFEDAVEANDGARASALAQRIEQMIVMGKLREKEPTAADTALDAKTRELKENLKQWFKQKWVRFGPDGKIRGPCARGKSSEGKSKCLPQAKAHALGKKGRAKAGSRKRRQDPEANRRGKAINVKTKEDVNNLQQGAIALGLRRAQDPQRMQENILPESVLLDQAQPCPRTQASQCQCESVNRITEDQQTVTAVVVLEHSDRVQGTILFKQQPGQPTLIVGEITGLNAGEHGFHIHEFGDLSQGCESAGAHYNPREVDHGDIENGHVGDLGNITADKTGRAQVRIVAERVNLTGKQSVVGRAIVVHEDRDDLGQGGDAESLKSGNAGARLACGVITLKDTVTEAASPAQQAAIAIAMKRAGKKPNAVSEGIPFDQCPACGGPIVHISLLSEKQDACYHKVKSRYKVWPSAYASGALVQCRKKGAANWGTGGKKK